MSNDVKRYYAVHLRYEDSNIRYGEGCEVEVVTASDYEREVMIAIAAGIRMQDKCAALEAECERLRNAPCECGAPVGYVSGEKYAAEHERLRECRKERDALRAEAEELRAQVSALQSDANSWQSGYDKGREDGAKAAEGWKAQHARDSAELRRLCAERDQQWRIRRDVEADRDTANAISSELRAERDALRAELEAIKGQEPVAFYWQDIGYPEPRTHGPHFGQPSEAALRNVDGGAIPVPLYTLPPAIRSPGVQASGPYASVADGLAKRYPKPSLLKDCSVSYSNSSRPLAEQGERQEVVAEYQQLSRYGNWDRVDKAVYDLGKLGDTPEKFRALYTTPQPGPDVRALLSADDVRDACANAVSVFAEETNASQCREVAEYMREVLLAQIAHHQDQPK